jgi:2,3-bisphosphoglycerate-dependent phosphoglycerate mutase
MGLIERVAGIAERAPGSSGTAAGSGHARTGTLALLRHGESEWNRAGRFTGWADVGLTPAGEAEAARAGRVLQSHGYTFDCCFTSALQRAIRSSEIVLRTMGLEHVAVERSWRLNERHYGALQGLGPWSAVRRFGVLPVLHARRRYDYRPPATDAGDAGLLDPHDAAGAPADEPRAESLADMRARLVPFWKERIAPELERGRSVLVVSHKHTLRALFALSTSHRDTTSSIRVATGVPIVLALDRTLAVTGRRVLRVSPSS